MEAKEKRRPVGWILFNDKGNENPDISYENNRFLQEAETCDFDVRLIAPRQIDIIATREGKKSILLDGKTVSLPDFIIPRMGAGTSYFSLAVIRQLERLGVQVFNGSLAIDTAKDKLYTMQILAQSHIPIPKTMLVKFPVPLDLVQDQIGFPIIIKTLYGSHGTGVFLAESRKHFQDLVQLIESTKANSNIIIQEFIKHSRGRDLRVFIVGGRAVACMERNAPEDEFKANFSTGGTVKPYEITPEIEWISLEAARMIGLDIAGVDLLFAEDGRWQVCEVNSSPGFRGMESCNDISIPAEIYNFIKIKLGDRFI